MLKPLPHKWHKLMRSQIVKCGRRVGQSRVTARNSYVVTVKNQQCWDTFILETMGK